MGGCGGRRGQAGAGGGCGGCKIFYGVALKMYI